MSDDNLIRKVKVLLTFVFTIDDVFKLEELREPLLSLRCKLQKEYLQGREKLRIPKDKDYTDFDRTTMLEAYSAELREQYELVKGLETLVTERIMLVRETK